MQSVYTEDQAQFREVVSRFLQDKSQSSAVRELMVSEEGYDREVWQQLSQEIGLVGTHIPEAYGGFGFGPVELGIVAEEMGRHLYCGPFFASAVMAGYALLGAANVSARENLLPGIAAGSTIASLVMDSLNSPHNVGGILREDDGLLTGNAVLVVDAHVADLLIVIASNEQGLGLYSLPADTSGVAIEALEVMDPTRKLSRVSFDGAAAEKIGDVSSDALNDIWNYICTALAHEMIGGAQRLLETTVEYTKMRFQFGRPIGSFQGLKHRCADWLMELEFAKATTHHAAFCLAAGEGEDYAPNMAKAMASDIYIKSAKEAIQMRGGIGFTWEEDTHLWYKRAKSSEVFMGSAEMHREQMMRLVEKQASGGLMSA
jgi:alkylation response protein AidB-like acyl-CoA dehydrogenase